MRSACGQARRRPRQWLRASAPTPSFQGAPISGLTALSLAEVRMRSTCTADSPHMAELPGVRAPLRRRGCVHHSSICRRHAYVQLGSMPHVCRGGATAFPSHCHPCAPFSRPRGRYRRETCGLPSSLKPASSRSDDVAGSTASLRGAMTPRVGKPRLPMHGRPAVSESSNACSLLLLADRRVLLLFARARFGATLNDTTDCVLFGVQ